MMKSQTVSVAECHFPLQRQKSAKRKALIPKKSTMSTKTRDFIQKICYRRTASIDMTQYGFINDSKMSPVNLMMKPLKAQLKKISIKVVHKMPSLPNNNTRKSALSYPKTGSRLRQENKERVQNEVKSTVKKKKVTLVVPAKKLKKKIAVIK